MSNRIPKSFKPGKEISIQQIEFFSRNGTMTYKDQFIPWNPGHSVLLPTHQSLQWLMKSNREIGIKTGSDSTALINDILTVKKVDRILNDMVKGTLGDWRNYD